MEATVAPANAPWVAFPSGTKIVAIDFDANKNVWAVGNNKSIFRVAPDATFKAFDFTGDATSVRVYNNDLYVLATVASNQSVWRFQIISSDSLGQAEKYFDFTDKIGGDSVSASVITIAADGDLYIGTDKMIDPVIIVHPDKSFEPLYPGVIGAQTYIYSFSWDPGNFLYFSEVPIFDNTGAVVKIPKIFRLNMQKNGAPQYGRL